MSQGNRGDQIVPANGIDKYARYFWSWGVSDPDGALATRLEPGADGKRKSLHKTALVQALSRGMDVEQLKTDDAMRAALHDAATDAAETLDGLVRVTGRRDQPLPP